MSSIFSNNTSQTACVNCSCGYNQSNTTERIKEMRKLSDDIKKANSTLTIKQLKNKLNELGISIVGIEGNQEATLRGDTIGLCAIALKRALYLIDREKVKLLEDQLEEQSEIGC